LYSLYAWLCITISKTV